MIYRSELRAIGTIPAKMVTKIVLLIALIFGINAQGQDELCPRQISRQIQSCTRNQISSSEQGTCEYLEIYINCTESIGANCMKKISHAGGALNKEFARGGSVDKITSSADCFHETFDKYFNQDGKCSFQDVKDILYCGAEKFTNPFGRNQRWCEMLKLAETCSNEINPDCIQFFKTYVGQVLNDLDYEQKRPGDFPDQCIQSFLGLGQNEANEPKDFPTFDKLVDELVLIQKLLKKQN